MKETLAELFSRPESLGTNRFPYEIRRHPDRDSGCRVDAVNFLRQFLGRYHYALVLFDRHGCGSDSPRQQIEGTVESALYRNGWENRSRVVVIDPELEEWVWSGSPAVSEALGWGPKYNKLQSWLAARGLWHDKAPKPDDPKSAMDKALESAPRTTRRRRSARVFGEIAAGVSVERCQDPAFKKLRTTLQDWFPRVGPS